MPSHLFIHRRGRFQFSYLIRAFCSLLLIGSSCQLARAQSDVPAKLSDEEAEALLTEGDRFAAQGDYQSAVERYNASYLSIVAKIRGQDYFTNVTPSLMTRDELSEEMKKQMKSEYSDKELHLMDATYKVFGLMKPKESTESLMTKLLSEEVGGFYDPQTKAMVLVRGNDQEREPGFLSRFFGQKATFDTEDQKTTLAHELTHALQDQLYDLLAMQRAIEKDDDMVLAFTALVEGDATLVMFGEMGRQQGDVRSMTEMEPQEAEFMFSFISMMLPFAGGETFRNAPPIFRKSLVFPYFEGMIFNLHLTRNGGFARVDSAYQSPPVSTEQIMHPQKYLDKADLPIGIEFDSPQQLLGSQWNHLGGNCMGEFQTSILLSRVPRGNQAAEGWGGDRFEIFENEAGDLAAVWMTTWDSEQDAIEFETAMTRYMQKRSGKSLLSLDSNETSDENKPSDSSSSEVASDAEGDGEEDTTSDSLFTIQHDGLDVAVLIGVNAKASLAAIDKMKNTKRSEKTFPIKPIKWPDQKSKKAGVSNEPESEKSEEPKR